MAHQENVMPRKRGQGLTGKGQLVGVRLQPDLLETLERWIAKHPRPRPLTRPEAIRRLLIKSLGEHPEQ
jgi:hypothetical protein